MRRFNLVRFSFVLTAILLMAQGVVAQPTASASDAEATARRVLGSFFSEFDTAASARDLDRFFGLFDNSPELIFAFNGEVIKGFDAAKKLHADSWAQLESVQFRTVPESVLILDGNRVIVTARGMSNRKYKDGRAIERPYAITMLIVRQAGKWRITHAHESIASK